MSRFSTIYNQAFSQTPVTTTGVGTLVNPNVGFLNAVGGDESDSGIRVNNFFAYNYTAYWRALNLISNDIGKVGKYLMAETSNGHEEQAGRLATILTEEPNQNQNQSQFYGLLTNHLLNWGNAFAVISRDFLGRPTKLTIKMPWETAIYITTETDPKERTKIFQFADEPGINYLAEDVLHVFRFSIDGYQGLNPLVYALRDSVGLGKVSEKYSSKFFANGGRGNGVVELKDSGIGYTDEEGEGSGDSEMAQIRASWESTYANSGSFFKTMFLEEGESYKAINTPPEALELLNTRVFQIGEIARIVGLPEYKLGAKDPKFANIEHLAIEYVSETLNPIVGLIKDEVKRKMLPTGGNQYMEFDTDSLIKSDMKSRFEAYSTGLGRNAPGFLTPEYVGKKERLPKFDKSELYRPMNMVPQNQTDEESI